MIKKEISDFVKLLNEQKYKDIYEALSHTSKDHVIHEFLSIINVEIFENANPKANFKKIFTSDIDHRAIKSDTDLSFYLIEGQNGKYCFLCDKSDDFGEKITQSMFKDHLKYIGRKTPTITKSMIEARYLNFNPEHLTKAYNKILEIKDIIKGKTYNEFYNLLKNNDLKKELLLKIVGKQDTPVDINYLIKSFKREKLVDFIDHSKEESKVISFIKQISSIKNRDLFTNQSQDYIREIIRLDITESDFRSEFSKKIAKYKSPKEFETSLKKYLDTKSDWCIENWNNKLAKHNLNKEEIYHNVYLIEINNFEQINQLGSTQWCIATDEEYFNQYTDDYQRQYMILDFNLDTENPNSMTGITVDIHGEILFAHDKNDNDLMYSSLVEKDYAPYANKIDPDILAEKIVKNNSHESNFFLYKEFGKYNIKNKHMTNCKKNLKNILEDMDVQDFFFDSLIFVSSQTQSNNISETVTLLKDSLDDEKFKKILTLAPTRDIARFTGLENGDVLQNILLSDFLPKNKQFIIFKEFCDQMYFQENFNNLVPKFYEKHKETFWHTWNNITDEMQLYNSYEEGDFFFSDSKILNFFKDKGLSTSVIAAGVFKFAHDDDIKVYFDSLTDDVKFECVNVFIDRKDLRGLFKLTKNNHLPLHRLTELMDDQINEDNYLEFLTYVSSYYSSNSNLSFNDSKGEEDNRHNTLFESIFMGIIKNVDTIDLNKIWHAGFIENDEIRNILFENDMLIPSQYAEYALSKHTFHKIGIPLVLDYLMSKEISSGYENDELEFMIKDVLENNIMTKKELKKELKPYGKLNLNSSILDSLKDNNKKSKANI